MKLVIGLGNPGEEYKENRHNIGFMVLDKLAEELKIKDYKLSDGAKAEYAWGTIGKEKIELFKPQIFMNSSGFSVGYAKKKHKDLKLSDIYVVHDDLDIPLGSYKVHFGKGPKNHKGLESISETLGTSGYWHVRLGVDNRDPKNRTAGEEYVLQDFTNEELMSLKETINKVVKDLCRKLATS